MKKFPIFAFLAAAALAALLPATAFAKSYKLPKVKAKPIVYHDTTIASVDASSITIKEDTATKTFKIGKDTEIDVDGQKATVGDLRTGMLVSVTVGLSPDEAARISMGGLPAHPTTKPNGKK